MVFDAGRPAVLGFNTLTFLKVVRFEGTMEERPWRKWLFERARNNNTHPSKDGFLKAIQRTVNLPERSTGKHTLFIYFTRFPCCPAFKAFLFH